MEENEALLKKETDFFSQKDYVTTYDRYRDEEINFCDSEASSSDESIGWLEESRSSCNSSCSGVESFCSIDWESKVDSNGEIFFIESGLRDKISPPPTCSNDPRLSFNEASAKVLGETKKGKLKKWMKKKNGKRTRQLEKQHGINESNVQKPSIREGKTQKVVLHIERIGKEDDLIEKMLGLAVLYSPDLQKYIITKFSSGGPGKKAAAEGKIDVGDILLSINNELVNPDNVGKILNQTLTLPTEIVLRIEKRKQMPPPLDSKRQNRSTLVRNLLESSKDLDSILSSQPMGVMFVKMTEDGNDLIYSYPPGSSLFSSRGSFVTLFHLFSNAAMKKNICSSSSYLNNVHINMLYVFEEDHLLLLAIPKNRCDASEATYIVADLLNCLRFNHSSLKRYFENSSLASLNHFFSVFFCRILMGGFSTDVLSKITFESIETFSIKDERTPASFEDVLPYARRIPLPKKFQMQVDDALNQAEANNAEYEEELGLDFKRPYIITGSCYYHKGYLLASHLSKKNLSSIHSFFRQNGLIHLFRNEPVKSLVILKRVFPFSEIEEDSFRLPVSVKRYYILIVGQEHDAVVFFLESRNSTNFENFDSLTCMIDAIEEAENTLNYIKELGVVKFVNFWLSDNLKGLKTCDEIENNLEAAEWLSMENKNGSEYGSSWKNRKMSHGDVSEDSTSQALSNVSEISDENIPILGRRAERRTAAAAAAASTCVPEPTSDESGNSDSDWESFKENLITTENTTTKNFIDSLDSGSGCGKLYRSTANNNNSLFYYVHLNGSQGILVTPNSNSQSSLDGTSKKVMSSFRKASLAIHLVLENNVRFKINNCNNSNSIVNKSLIAVKEQGLRFCCTTCESERSSSNNSRKSCSFCYWVIGRLFFTPQPREVYVCHYEDIPQHLVEIAFRLGLNASS